MVNHYRVVVAGAIHLTIMNVSLRSEQPISYSILAGDFDAKLDMSRQQGNLIFSEYPQYESQKLRLDGFFDREDGYGELKCSSRVCWTKRLLEESEYATPNTIPKRT